jgi:hypothetical protein
MGGDMGLPPPGGWYRQVCSKSGTCENLHLQIFDSIEVIGKYNKRLRLPALAGPSRFAGPPKIFPTTLSIWVEGKLLCQLFLGAKGAWILGIRAFWWRWGLDTAFSGGFEGFKYCGQVGEMGRLRWTVRRWVGKAEAG